LLDTADKTCNPAGPQGDPLSFYLEETETNLAIGWRGYYQIAGAAFIYRENDSGRLRTILGYPTRRIAQTPGTKISNMYG